MHQDHQIAFRLENVGVCYGDGLIRGRGKLNWALKDVSFEVPTGKTLGVVGRNGAGKSTLLRLLAGIAEPDEGSLVLNLERASLLTLRAGFIQELPGRENVVMSGLLLGMTREEIRGKMPDILEFSGVGSKIDEPIYTYSTGMLARLGFAVAYYFEPDIILIDEILGVGDREFKAKSTAAVKDKIKSSKTAVVVSHHLKVIEELCDLVAWIENGRLKMFGEVNEVMTEFRAS